MDTSVFVLKREEIQQRMQSRRLVSLSAHKDNPRRIVPWILSTGVELVTGLGGLGMAGKSYGWLGSLAGALVLPSVMKFLGHKNNNPPDSVWRRLAKAILPTLRI